MEKKEGLLTFEGRLKGKKGHLRQWSLGKRVDYSGRSVIVVEASLSMDECFLPRCMVLELLKPQVVSYLVRYGFAYSKKYATRMIDSGREEIWTFLEEIVEKEYPYFLLNRAPTLHKYGIGCFRAKLWKKKTIGLPPVVCAAFNADFDGDQMAVYPLISEEAKFEGAVLMRFSRNLISTTNGNIVVAVSKDIVLGLYILSLETEKERKKYFYDIRELENAHLQGKVEFNDPVSCIVEQVNEDGPFRKLEKTSLGRLFIWRIFPKHPKLNFELINKPLIGKDINELMKKVLKYAGDPALAKFVDDLKDLGMDYASKYGVSVGMTDLFEIQQKDKIIKKTVEKQIHIEEQYRDGLITLKEKENKIWDLWDQTIKQGADFIKKTLEKNIDNPISLLVTSGSRGSVQQLSQMFFCKGFLNTGTKHLSIVTECHKDGLSPIGYYESGMSVRESCKTVSIDTASSGYLTRKLAHTANNIIVSCVDCGTNQYIYIKNIFKNGVLLLDVYSQILHRVIGADIYHPITNELLVEKNVLITEDVCELLKKNFIVKVPVRSPTMCESTKGICIACYGGNPNLVSVGEAVGILAAQAIGEPGTQLTMKTYHGGGASQFEFTETSAITPYEGKVVFSKRSKSLEDYEGRRILISQNTQIFIQNEVSQIVANFEVPYGAILLVEEGDMVGKESVLATWGTTRPIISETSGKVNFFDFSEKISYEIFYDEATGRNKKNIIKSKLNPYITIVGEEEKIYFVPEGTIVEIEAGDLIKKGQVIAYARSEIKSIDIVSGLASVINIFENRSPEKEAILAPFDGIVFIEKDKRNRSFLKLFSKETEKEIIFQVAGGDILVQNETEVEKGSILTTGNLKWQSILDARGYHALIDAFVGGLHNIYKQHGLSMNSRHIEVILRQLCNRFEVENPKNTNLLQGQIIDLNEYRQICKKCILNHKSVPKVRRLIFGVTNTVLNSDGFLGAMSFEQMINLVSKVLFSSISADGGPFFDDLSSINSNVMLAGNHIPIGTLAELSNILEKEIPEEIAGTV